MLRDKRGGEWSRTGSVVFTLADFESPKAEGSQDWCVFGRDSLATAMNAYNPIFTR